MRGPKARPTNADILDRRSASGALHRVEKYFFERASLRSQVTNLLVLGRRRFPEQLRRAVCRNSHAKHVAVRLRSAAHTCETFDERGRVGFDPHVERLFVNLLE